MPIKATSRVAGSLQDVAKLLALPSDDCNVLLVNSQTLYLMANYAVSEVNFLGRYFIEEFDGGLVRTVESSDLEVPQIREVAQNFRNEVIPVTCDLVAELQAIASAINGLQSAGCCPPSGENPPQPPAVEGDPPPEGYEEYDPLITDRKCKLANMAVDDLIAVMDVLIDNDVTAIASLGFGAMSALWGLVVGLIAAGPVAWGLAGLGTVLALIGFFLVNTLDLLNLKSLIESNRQDIVCAFFNALTNQEAFDDLKTILGNAGATTVDLLFLDTLNLLDGLTTLFFAPEGEDGQAIEDRLDGFVATTDCSACATPEEFWVIMPDGTYQGFTGSGGLLGTGDIDQTGSSFTLNSVLGSDGSNPVHLLGIVVEGFRLSQVGDLNMLTLPAGAAGGSLTIETGLPIAAQGAAGRGSVLPCGNIIDTNGAGGNGAYNNRIMLLWWHQEVHGPFSITLRIDTQPTAC